MDFILLVFSWNELHSWLLIWRDSKTNFPLSNAICAFMHFYKAYHHYKFSSPFLLFLLPFFLVPFSLFVMLFPTIFILLSFILSSIASFPSYWKDNTLHSGAKTDCTLFRRSSPANNSILLFTIKIRVPVLSPSHRRVFLLTNWYGKIRNVLKIHFQMKTFNIFFLKNPMH